MPTIRWFGGAAEAAGTEAEPIPVSTLGEALDNALTAHASLAAVLPRCSLLLDGVRVTDRDTRLADGDTLDVLPPFAGG